MIGAPRRPFEVVQVELFRVFVQLAFARRVPLPSAAVQEPLRHRLARFPAEQCAVPLLVDGLAHEWSSALESWGWDELRRRWGAEEVGRISS